MQILIADDHAAVRRGLREILADALPEAHFSEAGDGDEVLRLLAKSEYAVLLLDINMPGLSGLDVLRDVKRNYPRLPVIIVSVQPEDQYATRCLRAGAAAYINKDRAPESLCERSPWFERLLLRQPRLCGNGSNAITLLVETQMLTVGIALQVDAEKPTQNPVFSYANAYSPPLLSSRTTKAIVEVHSTAQQAVHFAKEDRMQKGARKWKSRPESSSWTASRRKL